MAQFSQIFMYLLIVQMFYSFSVSVFVPLIPAAQQNQVVAYNNNGTIDFTVLANTVQGAVGEQYTVPFLDVGALIFYSTSIVLNLVINFITAIPQMLTILLSALFAFVPLPYTIQLNVKTLFLVMVTVIYYILLIFFILGQRTGQQYV